VRPLQHQARGLGDIIAGFKSYLLRQESQLHSGSGVQGMVKQGVIAIRRRTHLLQEIGEQLGVIKDNAIVLSITISLSLSLSLLLFFLQGKFQVESPFDAMSHRTRYVIEILGGGGRI